MTDLRTARHLADALRSVLDDLATGYGLGEGDDAFEGANVNTFADAGLLTRDQGVVIRFPNGAEFQVTVVQSERPHDGVECDWCGDSFARFEDLDAHLRDEHAWTDDDFVVAGAAGDLRESE